MPSPSAEQFRALARSAAWLWRSVRFVHREDDPDPEGVRAWVRRPGGLRVESLSGQLVAASLDTAVHPRARGILVLGEPGSPPPKPPTLVWWTDPRAPQPRWRDDGLVAWRPSEWDVSPDQRYWVEYDDPMYGDYRWVAMLDPRELADGSPAEDADPASGEHPLVPARLSEVCELDVAGRLTWEAVAEPLAEYDPRCSCCPLMPSAASDAREGDAARPPDAYPSAHRIRLDRATGICVSAREIGGSTPGRGHDLVIEEVDADYPDDLFAVPGRRRWRGLASWTGIR